MKYLFAILALSLCCHAQHFIGTNAMSLEGPVTSQLIPLSPLPGIPITQLTPGSVVLGSPIAIRFLPTYTNGEMEIVVVLSKQDVWAAEQQIARGGIAAHTLMPTNAPVLTVSNFFARMFHNQVRGFTGMELQQFEWERRARVANAPRDVQDRIHALLSLSNAPPALITPPTP